MALRQAQIVLNNAQKGSDLLVVENLLRQALVVGDNDGALQDDDRDTAWTRLVLILLQRGSSKSLVEANK